MPVLRGYRFCVQKELLILLSPFFCWGGMAAVCSAWLFVLCPDKDMPCLVNSEARPDLRQDSWKALNGISYD
jgi:hypothetical protein